jgi:hypothetical protein
VGESQEVDVELHDGRTLLAKVVSPSSRSMGRVPFPSFPWGTQIG